LIRSITEIGVAVRDLDASVRSLVDKLGAAPGPMQVFEPYGMKFCMCRVGNVDFELMAPLGEGGVIEKFLLRRGEGLHHIGFAVDDASEAQRELSTRGLEFLDAAPRRQRFLMSDFAGTPFDEEFAFAFSRPGSLLGVMLEFIQYPTGFVGPMER
jgi:methylmalonyl-CoA/ethylmalonyl-CoA epimerase